ncbi:Arylesterase precursor [Symmachiella dynata]|uniref:SGNH/GDSL hydrolase family protein n=1 Tax=Symmachiella dynata TaxID=2527995 RepID=UPI00118B3E4C|nr:GDSL-type esterase/lipase family protein [Symmachiella dynata]QDT46230.1 Arylesterase precursor [Symmachiella dynata]
MIRFADSKYCFLLCAGLAVSAIASTAVAEEHFPQFKQSLDERDRTVKVVCFGDSVTGIYYHTGGRRAYTKLVQIALEKTKPRAIVQAINAGISGHTTRDALARIEKNVLAHKPDLVTVMFGLNDMTRVPLFEYRDNLTKIIEMCRAAGAEVLLCTPNSVYDTKSRPEAKLEKYVAAVHQVAQAQQVEVADCYAAYQSLRSRDEFAWATLMSDEIHPNLDGHKLIAEEIVQAILGRRILLKDIPVSTPSIPWTRGKLQKKQPIHILAMPPFDAQIKVAIRRIYPNADIKVTTWETAGKSLGDIEEQSKTIRKMAPDLVVIAVPIETTSSSREQYVRTYSWILNYALSFGLRTWDVIAIDPALASEPSSPEQRSRARLVQQLVRAQDLPFVKRPEDNSTPSGDVLKQWFAEQLGKPNTR